MEAWIVAILCLSALFVGMMVPVLLTLRSTLATFRSELRATSERLGPALDDARITTQRIRRITDSLEGKEDELGELVHSAGELARSIDRLRNTTHVASAVAAAVAAGVRAFREGVRPEPEPEPEPEPATRTEIVYPPPPSNGEPKQQTQETAHE